MPKSNAAQRLLPERPLIPSISVRGYKCFSELSVSSFGHINLIIGANSVGKTTLLEALRIYASRGGIEDIAEILDSRDELPSDRAERRGEFDKGWFLQKLFSLEAFSGDSLPKMEIGALGNPLLRFIPEVRSRSSEKEADRTFGSIVGRRFDLIVEYDRKKSTLSSEELQHVGGYMRDFPGRGRWQMKSAMRRRKGWEERGGAVYVSPRGMDSATLSLLWDDIALTDAEDDVVSALKIIAPKLEKITFIGGDKYDDGPIPMIRLAGAREPVTLRSAGDGMARLLGISLALVNARDGVLLIDEVENGIHYSAQEKLWRMIAKTAQQLNVQVFATTHSFDCIEAFAQVAAGDANVEGRLIKLRRDASDNRIDAVEFGEDDLAAITKGRIEVR